MSGPHLPIVQTRKVFYVPACTSTRLPCVAFKCRHHMTRGEGSPLPTGYDTCSLGAVARNGEHTYEEIGQTLGLVRERVRQIESGAVAKLKRARPDLAEYIDSFTSAESFAFPDSVEISEYRPRAPASGVRLIANVRGHDRMFPVGVATDDMGALDEPGFDDCSAHELRVVSSSTSSEVRLSVSIDPDNSATRGIMGAGGGE